MTVYVPLSFTPPAAPPGCSDFGATKPGQPGAQPEPSLLDRAGKWIQGLTHIEVEGECPECRRSWPVPRLRLLALLPVAAGAGRLCDVSASPSARRRSRPVRAGRGDPGQRGPFPDAATNAVPAPAPAAPPVTAPPAARQFHLGAAASALVAQAHRQAAGGDPQLAISTLERALRIEPDNPLLWIELGEVHESRGHFEQAGGIGHKALQLATGDPHAQSASWHLIAESLKARSRNGEASRSAAPGR